MLYKYAQAVLDSIPDGQVIKDITRFVPCDVPLSYQLEGALRCLMSLDDRFRYDGHMWRKVSHQEWVNFRREKYLEKYHLLMTNPSALVN